jgi:PhnB protein
MQQVHVGPFINFQGRAREAMELYQRALGGEVQVQEDAGRVNYARLDVDGTAIVGSDGHPNYPPTVGDNIAVALSGQDRDRLTRAFDTLAEGGQVKGRLRQQGPGAEVGYLLDRFGINWVISIQAG